MSLSLPTVNDVLQPLLEAIGYWKFQRPIPTKAIRLELENKFNLTEEQRTLRTVQGNETVFGSRINWAKFNLKKAGLVVYPKRGHVDLTHRGFLALNGGLEFFTINDLRCYPSFDEYFLENIEKQKAREKANKLFPIKKKTKREIEFYRKIIFLWDFEYSRFNAYEFLCELENLVKQYDYEQERKEKEVDNESFIAEKSNTVNENSFDLFF
jgi:hypothetical protein